MKKRDLIEEVMSLVPCKWQKAKTIVRLSEMPPGTCKSIRGLGIAGRPLIMTQREAHTLVEQARTRIALVDGD